MNDYIEVRIDISPCNEIYTDILAAELGEIGFESFVPDENGLTAYIKEELFDKSSFGNVIREFSMPYQSLDVNSKKIEGKDWNKEWEKNYFKPIVIDDVCVIHSTFHKDYPSCRYDIVIDPKMAFGTGHHATTTLVIRNLLARDLSGIKMVDMGTGTGILSILASMKGASRIDAIEIDEFAFSNAIENVRLNFAESIRLHLGDASELARIEGVNLFVANINRNIIMADLPAYVKTLAPGAEMILSGFYEEDIPVILEVAEPLGLTYQSQSELDRWACLVLKF